MSILRLGESAFHIASSLTTTPEDAVAGTPVALGDLTGVVLSTGEDASKSVIYVGPSLTRQPVVEVVVGDVEVPIYFYPEGTGVEAAPWLSIVAPDTEQDVILFGIRTVRESAAAGISMSHVLHIPTLNVIVAVP